MNTYMCLCLCLSDKNLHATRRTWRLEKDWRTRRTSPWRVDAQRNLAASTCSRLQEEVGVELNGTGWTGSHKEIKKSKQVPGAVVENVEYEGQQRASTRMASMRQAKDQAAVAHRWKRKTDKGMLQSKHRRLSWATADDIEIRVERVSDVDKVYSVSARRGSRFQTAARGPSGQRVRCDRGKRQRLLLESEESGERVKSGVTLTFVGVKKGYLNAHG